MQYEFSVAPIDIGVDSVVTILYGAPVVTEYPELLSGRLLIDFKYRPDDEVYVFSLDSSVTPEHFSPRTAILEGDNIGAVSLSFTIPAALTALLFRSSVFFDIVAYNGTAPRRIPGRWQWPVIASITTPRP